MRAMNPSQTGRATELRFCSLVIMGSGGLIEIVPPLADDERRDFELHLKHRFGRPLSMQVRSATRLTRRHGLKIHVHRGRRRPVDPAYWFFAAHLDLKALDFADPMFLIPSEALRRGSRLVKYVCPSLREDARDKWVKYRVTRADLGARLLEILEKLRGRPEVSLA